MTSHRLLLEEHRTALEKEVATAIKLRETFNKNAYTVALLPPAAFNRNTAATEKKKREVELARILNEKHLTGVLTAECGEAKELLTMHGGQALANLSKQLPKEILDVVLPGGRGTDGVLSNFETARTKSECSAWQNIIKMLAKYHKIPMLRGKGVKVLRTAI